MEVKEESFSTPLRGKYLCRSNLLFFYFFLVDSIILFISFFYDLKNKNAEPKKFKRILLSHSAHLGDALMLSYVLPQIKNKYPDCEIDLLIASWSIPIFRKNKKINKFFTIDHWKINRSDENIISKFFQYWINFIKLLHQMKNYQQYDVAIDFNPFYPNNILFLRLLNPKLLVSYNSSGFGYLSNISVKWQYKFIHTIQYNVSLLKYIGIESLIPLKADLCFKTIDISEDEYIVIQPCSGEPLRELSIEFWIKLVNMINSQGYKIYFLGSSRREYEISHKVLSSVRKIKDNKNLVGKLQWDKYLSYVEQCKILIGVESFSGHLAATFNKKSITIKTGITDDAHWRPFSSNNILMRYDTKCYPCHNRRGCKSMDCINKITPESVFLNFIKLTKK